MPLLELGLDSSTVRQEEDMDIGVKGSIVAVGGIGVRRSRHNIHNLTLTAQLVPIDQKQKKQDT